MGPALGQELERSFLVAFDQPVTGVDDTDFAAAGTACATGLSVVDHRFLDLTAPVNTRISVDGFNAFPSTAITVEFWVRTSDGGGGLFAYNASPTEIDEFRIRGPQGLAVELNGIQEISAGSAVNDNNWHHVAVTWSSASGQLILYVDGAIDQSTVVQQGASLSPGGFLSFAQGQSGFGSTFTANTEGLFDDVRVWDQVRSQAEILADMNHALTGNEPGLVLYWPMDEYVNLNIGDTAVDDIEDFSPFGNHGDSNPNLGFFTASTLPLDGTRIRVDVSYDPAVVLTTLGLDVLDDGSIMNGGGLSLTGAFSGGEQFSIAADLSLVALVHVPGDFPTIQAAIDASCDGMIIELAPGIYQETDIDFQGKAITLRGTGAPEETVIDAQNAGRILLLNSGEGPTTLIENLTLFDGRAPNSNTATRHGAAASISNSAATFRRCHFISNRAGNGTGGATGGHGGAVMALNSTVTFEDCLFDSNRAGNGASDRRGGGGGAMWVRQGAQVSLTRCRFQDNSAGNGTDGNIINEARGGDGGAIDLTDNGSSVTLLNCELTGNSGGVGHPTFAPAGRPGYGGALSANDNSTMTVINTTIAGNTTEDPPGLDPVSRSQTFITSSVTFTVDNSIIRGPGVNSVNWMGHTINYSNIKDIGAVGVGNIDISAVFVDLPGGDLNLTASSPCVDAGNTSFGAKLDISGAQRSYGPQVDMGAREFQSITGTNEDLELTLATSDLDLGISPGEIIRLSMSSPNFTFLGADLALVTQFLPSGSVAPDTAGFPGLHFNFATGSAPLLAYGQATLFGPPAIGPNPTDYFVVIPLFASDVSFLWQALAITSAANNNFFAATDAVLTYVRP